MENRTQISEIKSITKRTSGIELLRIIALGGVILIHYNQFLLPQMMENSNIHILLFLRSLSSSAVDVFLIISGYFLCRTSIRYFGKPIDLLCQVVFRNLIVLLALCITDIDAFSIKALVAAFIPASYYPILFAVLYIVSPYINIVINGLSQKGLNVFMIIIITFFSVYPILVDLFQEVANVEWMGLSTIGAWGNQQGFTIINFSLCYCIGAYVRIADLRSRFSNKKLPLIGILVSVIAIFLWSELCMHLSHHGLYSSWCYHNPLVLLLALSSFLFFLNLNFYNDLINSVAKLVFMCFIIHSGIMTHFDIGLNNLVYKPFYFTVIHFIVFTTLMFIVSFLCNKIYKLVSHKFLDTLNRFEVSYHISTK